jgi:hypothetical protein
MGLRLVAGRETLRCQGHVDLVDRGEVIREELLDPPFSSASCSNASRRCRCKSPTEYAGLNSSGSTPFAEKIPSSICTRCSSCCARENRSLIPARPGSTAVCSTRAAQFQAQCVVHSPFCAQAPLTYHPAEITDEAPTASPPPTPPPARSKPNATSLALPSAGASPRARPVSSCTHSTLPLPHKRTNDSEPVPSVPAEHFAKPGERTTNPAWVMVVAYCHLRLHLGRISSHQRFDRDIVIVSQGLLRCAWTKSEECRVPDWRCANAGPLA